MQHVLKSVGNDLAGETIIFTPEDNQFLDEFINNNILFKISKKFMDKNLFIYSAENYENEEVYTTYGITKTSNNHHDNEIKLNKKEFKNMVDGNAFSDGLTKIIRCSYNDTYIDFIFSKTHQLIKAKVYDEEIPEWCEDLRV